MVGNHGPRHGNRFPAGWRRASRTLPAGIDAVTAVYSGDGEFRRQHFGPGWARIVISTVAGNGSSGWGDSGDSGPAIAAKLCDPSSVAVHAAGDIFIAESVNSRIREVNHATGVITTIAGNGTWAIPAMAARPPQPSWVTRWSSFWTPQAISSSPTGTTTWFVRSISQPE